jgi:hypothetical protein
MIPTSLVLKEHKVWQSAKAINNSKFNRIYAVPGLFLQPNDSKKIGYSKNQTEKSTIKMKHIREGNGSFLRIF